MADYELYNKVAIHVCHKYKLIIMLYIKLMCDKKHNIQTNTCSCVCIVQGTCGDILMKEKLNRPGCNKKMYVIMFNI